MWRVHGLRYLNGEFTVAPPLFITVYLDILDKIIITYTEKQLDHKQHLKCNGLISINL
jgi:hypothetical protein